jgi:hypothetical protein
MIRNRVCLDDLAGMETGAVAALPVDQLALLAGEAQEALDRAKRIKERLDGALDLRYGERAAALRRAEGRDTGTARIEDGGFVVVADLPKRVKWDQACLARIVERIREAGEDPSEYVAVEFKVSERAYGAWPSSIRTAFEPARTVETGKPVYRIDPPKQETL